MYQITVENFGGCEKASIAVDGISLLVGKNKAGKSSILDAVAWALAGKMDLQAVQKNEAGQVVRSGQDRATVTVTSPSGSIRASFPDCAFKTEGTQPTATFYATGQRSIIGLKDEDKAAALQEYLKTLPDQNDLARELTKFRIEKQVIESVWMRIVAGSWDKALAFYEDQGKGLKGQWKQATGRPGYGSDIASKWLPIGWEQDLEGLAIESIADEYSREKEMLESSLKFEAVSEKEISDLQEVLLGLDQAQTDHAEHVRTAAELKKELFVSEELLRKLPQPVKKQETVACPHCTKALVVVGGTVKKPDTAEISDDEIAKRHAAIREQKEASAKIESKLNFENKLIAEAAQRIDAANKANARLAEIAKQPTCPPAEQVEKQRKAVERSWNRLDAATKKRSADAINDSIVRNQFVIDVLKPDALRATKLSAALKQFNKKILQPLCEAARESDSEWGDVEIGSDLRISIGGKAKRLSKSERYRMRVTLQVAFAVSDKSNMLVIDDADDVDEDGRGGLLAMLQATPIPALVAIATRKTDEIPDLVEAGIGRNYVMAKAVCQEQQRKAAAVAA